MQDILVVNGEVIWEDDDMISKAIYGQLVTWEKVYFMRNTVADYLNI